MRKLSLIFFLCAAVSTFAQTIRLQTIEPKVGTSTVTISGTVLMSSGTIGAGVTYLGATGTSSYATTSGTSSYSSTSGTAATISGTIQSTQVSGTAATLSGTQTLTNKTLQGLTSISSGTFYSRSGLMFSGTSDRQTLGIGVVSPFDNTTYSGTSTQPNWSVSFLGINVKHDSTSSNGWAYIDPSYPHNCFVEQENRWTTGGKEQAEMGWFIDNDAFRPWNVTYCIEDGTGEFGVGIPISLNNALPSVHDRSLEIKYSGTDLGKGGILLSRGTTGLAVPNMAIEWKRWDSGGAYQKLEFAPRGLDQAEASWVSNFGNVLTYGTSGNYMFGGYDVSPSGWETVIDNPTHMIQVGQRTTLSRSIGGLRWLFQNDQTGNLLDFYKSSNDVFYITASGSASMTGFGVQNLLRLEPTNGGVLRIGGTAIAYNNDITGPAVAIGGRASTGSILQGESNAALKIYRGATTGNQGEDPEIILESGSASNYGVAFRREGAGVDLTDTSVAPVYKAPFARLHRTSGFNRGTFLFGGTTTQTTSQVWIQNDATNKPCLILNGTNGQTADIQQWLVNSGTVASVDAGGKFNGVLSGMIKSGTYSSDLVLSGTTLVGISPEQTVLTMTGTSQVVVSGSNVTLQNLTIQRSGTSPLPVFHCAVTGTDNWLSGIALRNVHIINTSGTAIGTWTAEGHSIYAEGKDAVGEMFYGGKCWDSTFKNSALIVTGTYSTEPETFVWKWVQSAGSYTGNFGSEFDGTRTAAEFNNCNLIGRSPNCRVFFGLVESSTAGYQSWMDSSVCAYPTSFTGCNIYGPIATSDDGATGGVGDNAASTAGVYTMKGGSVMGDNTFMNVHDGYVIGCYLVNWSHGANDYLVNGMSTFTVTGCTVVAGVAPITNVSNPISGFRHCLFEGDIVKTTGTGLYQWSVQSSLDAYHNLFGPERNISAPMFSGTSLLQIMESQPCTDYNLPEFTCEAWIKTSNTTSADCGIVSFDRPNESWWIHLKPSESKVIGVCYAGGTGSQISVVLTGTDVITGTTASETSDWHHLALTLTSGSARLFVDGKLKGSAAGAMGTQTKRLIVGASGSNINAGAAADIPGCTMIRELRISNVCRWTADFTPPKRLLPDSSTVSLYSCWSPGEYFPDPTTNVVKSRWKDQMGTQDVRSIYGVAWVPLNYVPIP